MHVGLMVMPSKGEAMATWPLAKQRPCLHGARPKTLLESGVDTLVILAQEAQREVDVLAKAVAAQHEVIRNVVRALGIAAGSRFAEQHKVIVKRMIDAVQELHDASTAEAQLRDNLMQLGYIYTTVAPMPYTGASNPDDNTGTAAYYWMRDAKSYIQTAGQKHTESLLKRLAKATA